MNNVNFFKENKYVVVKNSIDSNLRDFITQYALFDEMKNFNTDSQVMYAHSKYADPAMESLLLLIKDTVENNTGISLYPTYSYYRVYRNNDTLEKHIDRPACEISVSLCLNYSYDDKKNKWPLYIDKKEIILYPGDLVIYRGIEKYHWRDKADINEDFWQVQAFLHYVEIDGPNSHWKYDQRNSIGEEHPRNKKSYIYFNGKERK